MAASYSPDAFSPPVPEPSGGRSAAGTSWVRVGPAGRFRIVLPATKPGLLTVKLTLAPAAGYAPKSATKRRRIALPYLHRDRAARSVRLLERMLRDRHYAIPRVDSFYGYDTVEAVWAFQKVYRLGANRARDTGALAAAQPGRSACRPGQAR